MSRKIIWILFFLTTALLVVIQKGWANTSTGAPVLQSQVPNHQAMFVNPDEDLVLTFDQAIQLGINGVTKQIAIYRSGGTLHQLIALDAGNISGSTLTVSHDEFDQDQSYYVIMNAGVIADVSTNTSFGGFTQNTDWTFTTHDFVSIPDENFADALLDHDPVIDANDDGFISFSEAEAFSGFLNMGSKGIVDATGIEAFTGVTVLHFTSNDLTSIDLSQNTALTFLAVNDNALTSLDLSNNPLLTGVFANINNLSTLDISANTLLRDLLLQQNQLTSLDVSHIEPLERLLATDNMIESFDLSANPNIDEFKMDNNALTSLNLKNGNPTNIFNFDISENSGLSCVIVDDAEYSTLNWTNVDGGLTFSDTYCSLDDPVYIPDENFKAALVGDNAINTNEDGEISYGEAQVVESIIADNQGIIDLTGLEAFSNLTTLWLTNNSIVSADLTSNTLLETAVLNGNSGLTSVDVSGLTELLNFQVKGGDLTELDVSTNTKLQGFEFYQNDIAEIDISNNPDLRTINFSLNDLTVLDVSNNLELRTLNFWSNQVSTPLDISQHPHITTVQFSSNQITEINLANGFNENITLINGSGNPATCVKVDDTAYSEAEWANKFDEGVNFSDTYCDPNDPVYIPDENFKAVLLANTAINTTNDGEITYLEAEAFTGKLSANSSEIVSLEGLEAFINLTELEAYNNQIDEVDLSSNTQLTFINLSLNNLTSLDISNQPDLELISAFSNSIGPTVDVSQNPSLTSFYLHDNDLSFIDINDNTLLINLNVSNNDIEELNVDQLVELMELSCATSSLQELDVSNNPKLRELYVNSTNITSLDLSKNPELRVLWAQNNGLTSLNMQNGANELIVAKTPTANFRISNNSLTCVRVDDVAYSTSEWTDIDAGVTFSDTYCDLSDPVNIPDENFKALLVANSSINTNEDAEISYAEAEAFTGTISANGQEIADATGLEAFINITALLIHQNDLMELDLSKNTALEILRCYQNDLTTLDLSNNPSIYTLAAFYNQLTEVVFPAENSEMSHIELQGNNMSSIDVSNLPLLNALFLSQNNFSDVDISNSLLLERLVIDDNNFTDIDLSNHPEITVFYAPNNDLQVLNLKNGANENITSFDVTGNANLTCIEVDDAAYSADNWENIDEQAGFSEDCDAVYIPDETFKNYLLAQGSINTTDDGRITFEEAEAFTGTISVQNMGIDDLIGIEAFINLTGLVAWLNNITSVDLSNNAKLQTLELNSNPLESLDITQLPLLRTLILNDAPVGDFDMSNNTDLEDLRLVNIGMTSISVTHLPDLRTFMIKENPAITSVDVTQNPNLRDFRFGSTGITSIDISQNQQLATIEMLASDVSVLELGNHPNLSILDVRSSDLTLLDISNCPSLFTLRVANTAIQEIDASNNSSLTVLDASNMAGLTTLNIKNGNNANVTTFNLSNSPNVSCVTVDDVGYSEANWTQIEAGIVFSTDCSNDATDITAYDQVGSVSDASIDDENHMVTLEMPFGTDVTSLSPSITISDGASISPEGPQDFTSPVTYTITAEDRQTTQDWVVTVSVAENLAPTVEIEIEDQSETIGFGSVEISTSGVFVDPEGQDLTITATSSDETVVTVSVGESDQIIVTEQGIGASTITVTADDGFGGTVSDTFVFAVDQLTLGTNDLEGIKVYPNPTQGLVSLDGLNQAFSVRVLDLNGREVIRKFNEKEISLSGLKAGMYLLQIELADGSNKVIRISKTN